MALIIGVACNIFIVGINQIADVNIDKINKPYLPIPAGELSVKKAKIITYGFLILSLSFAFFISAYLFLIISLAATIGWAYSMPPLYLKKHHITAALAITFVRGILINVGGFMVFNYVINQSWNLPTDVKILTVFIVVFTIVISWFKDLPDIEGDSEHKIKTLAIVSSPKSVLVIGTLLIILTYLLTILLKYTEVINSPNQSFQAIVLFYGNIFLMVLFAINSFTVNLTKHESVKKFYKRFWWFFFAEYVLFLIAYLF
jgi:homogentisate phytyltransferase/homogentisate geranylgeranyltransferase